MKTIFYFLACAMLCFPFSVLNAQDFQGVAYYQSKTTMDMSSWGGNRQISEQQKKQWAERMKSFLEKTYVLTFNQAESIYKEEEKLDAPGRGGWGAMMGSSFSAGPQYKNVKDMQYVQDQEFFGKQFLIKEDLQALEWKMGSETKKIGKYTCFKATATKTVDEFDWRSMRRRDRSQDKKKDSTKTDETSKDSEDPMNEIEVPKTIEVTAWYTPEIPINQGPGEYWGLPGLILEVNADRTTILCSKIVMNPGQKELIEVPEKGQEVTKKEYNEIITAKMKEMREMYGRRRGNSRRN